MNNQKILNIPIYAFIIYAISLVGSITYLILCFILNFNIISILISIFLIIISTILLFIGYFTEKKNILIITTIISVIITISLIVLTIININKDNDYVIDFTNYDIKDVVSWANERKIKIKEEYEYNSKVLEHHVISQDIKPNTNIKKVKEINLVISNGIDPNTKKNLENMIGWNLDKVIKYVDDNKLSNVKINFVYSNDKKDTIIDQNKTEEIKISDEIILTSSLGLESGIKDIEMINLIGKDLWHAEIFLKRNSIKYNLEYEYSDKGNDIVLSQNIKKLEIINKDRLKEVVLKISKENLVTMPDLKKKTVDYVTTWAANNHMRINFNYEYDDTINKDLIISQDITPKTNISTNTLINFIISKGSIKMIEFTNIDEFKEWANLNDISYKINYEYNDKIEQGKLIKSSLNKGDIIKNNDTIILTLSDGSDTKVPNFIDKTKDEADTLCKENKLKCKYEYLNDNKEYNIVTNQSMKLNSTVPTNTTITLTLGK